MNLIWLLVVVIVIVALLGSPQLGVWQHSYGWGPSGIGIVLVIILVVLLLTGRI